MSMDEFRYLAVRKGHHIQQLAAIDIGETHAIVNCTKDHR